MKPETAKSDVSLKKHRKRKGHESSILMSKDPKRRYDEDTNSKPKDAVQIENDSISTPHSGKMIGLHGGGAESDSSSSVPSSTDDDSDASSPNTRKEKSMHVIAPEQKPASSIMKKFGAIDEAFDDFDLDGDLLEGRADHSSNCSTAQVENSPVSDEIANALRMSSLPIKEAAASWDLAPFLVENMERDGYQHFFPIQSLVIPDVIASERHAHIRARDVCVAAPTGSGKTLAFVLPVLNALYNRKIRRLRALVVLPSRDLGVSR